MLSECYVFYLYVYSLQTCVKIGGFVEFVVYLMYVRTSHSTVRTKAGEEMKRNFLITGAAAGIGLEYSRLMLGEGGRVVMTDINSQLGAEQETKLRAEFGESQVKFIKLDVRAEAEWTEVWEAAELWLESPVEVLINNAGLFSRTDWRPMFEVNLGGLIVGSLLAVSRMGLRGGGRGGTIINTASLAGILTGGFHTPVEEVYTATKQAVVGWTRSLGEKNSVWTEDRVRQQSGPAEWGTLEVRESH